MAFPWLRRIKRRLARDAADGRRVHPAPLPENRPPETAFPWHEVITEALGTWRTPLYINAWLPVREALEGLAPLAQLGVPVRHWLSVKTQPVKPPLVAWGRQLRFGAEVISPFELHAVRDAGFAANDILLNGVAKHAWVPADIPGLRLHLDSLTEAKAIGPERLKRHRLGARCFIESGHSADDP